MSSWRISGWHIGLFLLAVVGAIFHLWQADLTRFSGLIGTYFVVAGVLFLAGGVIVLAGGRGWLFKLGAFVVIALSAIDNGLLYVTRTYGMGLVFSLFPGSRPFPARPFNGTFPAGGFNGTGTRLFNGTFTGRPFVRGVPWSTSWFPPGAVQFFVLQTIIIVVAALALWRVGKGASGPLE